MFHQPSTVTVEHETLASPAQVWAVLADGWAYPTWVVGACRVRIVEPHWPEVGQRIHHSVGTWPILLNDTTKVLAADEMASLTLLARGWPAGEATVGIELLPWRGGTLIRIEEDATSGPATLIPQTLRQLSIAARNRESLRRLAFLAEGRHHELSPGQP